MKTYAIVYFGTALLALLLVPIVSRLAKWYNLVDAPGPRKVHKNPIPRLGGIAFIVSALALVLPVFFLDNAVGESFRESRVQFIVLMVSAAFVFAVGLLDDLFGIRGHIKLLCLVGAAVAICVSGATIRSIAVGTWFELNTGWFAWPLSVSWIVMITVCMNLIDGLDGLAAGIAAIVCGTIVVLALWTGQTAMAVLMLALLGSVTGFLFFNFYPAKIFMGDCGSMFLGFMIGAGSLVCQTKTSTMVGLAIPFLVMGVPILDASLVVVGRRILERRSMFAPDRKHLHHRMMDLGLRHRAVVLIIYAVTGLTAVLGMFMLTEDGSHGIGLLAGGLLFLFSAFACLHSGRSSKIIETLRRNWAIAHKARAEKRSFESAQLRMREATSFDAWWQTLCRMGRQMQFRSVGLWDHNAESFVGTCQWDAPKDNQTGRYVKLSLPLSAYGEGRWEIRASIWANGCLEVSGRQGMLLSRLMDEFPPPDQDQGIGTSDRRGEMICQPAAEQKVAPLVATVEPAEASKKRVQIPGSVDIMGVPVMPFESYDQALGCAEDAIEAGRKSFWVAINPIKIYNAWHKPELMSLLQQADVGICDGVGVSITSWLLHGHSIKRCTGCDLFFKVIGRASQKGWSVYLLGASAQSNAAARTRLQKMYPDLRIVGWRDGYFEDSEEVIADINSSGADLLFVAMGSPRQERWISTNRRAIDAAFCMGVGGSFDVASGGLSRAPKIARITGTEFLFRLIMEPRKRWKIQKVLLPYFLAVLGRRLSDFIMLKDGSGELTRH